MFARSSLLVLGLCVLCLSGCTSSSQPPAPSKEAFGLENQVHPAFAGNLIPKAQSSPSPLVDPSPLTSGGDPLAAPDQMSGDQLAGSDTLAGDPGAPSSSNKTRSIKNWYWLKGSVANGIVTVNVNSIPIGRFSVYVDKEISNYLDRGSNTITITSTPTIPGTPVDCNLKVIYSQQAPGAMPVVSYNSESDSPQPTSSPDVATQTGEATTGTSSMALPPIDSLDPSGGGTSKALTFVAL